MKFARIRPAMGVAALLCALYCAPGARAGENLASLAQLGHVNFPTSCSATAQSTINRGVALLHSFQYQESGQTFSDAAEQDPKCAMAYWGKAMTLYHQLWDFPSTATLAKGRQDIAEAEKLNAGTARERGYISAVAVFYHEDPALSHTERMQAYAEAMDKLHRDNPGDENAAEFYALSLIALAQDGDDAMANRRKAIAILDPLFAQDPESPGAAHYLIHATDDPELAPQGLAAARAYAKIAPDSSHAVHMPSHIFRRLGLWQEMIDSNLAAVATAAKATEAHTADASYQYHAMDFLDYAYLQSGQEAKARDLVTEAKSVPGASEDEIVNRANLIAVCNAIELHSWKEAASLEIPNEGLDRQEATYWVRTIGAARSGDLAGAHRDLQKLNEATDAVIALQKKRGEKMNPGESVDQREAAGWLAWAEGKPDEAVAKLRSAAEREEALREDPSCVPAREMLADLFLELKRPTDALTEYKAVLKNYPNRFDALLGAARAAQASGQVDVAREYYSKLISICLPGADRPELNEARKYVAAHPS